MKKLNFSKTGIGEEVSVKKRLRYYFGAKALREDLENRKIRTSDFYQICTISINGPVVVRS